MVITPEGEALKRYCQNAMALEGETLAQFGNAPERRSLPIGFTGPSSLLRFRLLPALIPILRDYSFLIPQIQFVDQPVWVDLLKSGKAQLAILPQTALVPELETKLLKPEQFVLLGPRKWANRSIQDIVKVERNIQFGCEDRFVLRYLEHFEIANSIRPEKYLVNNNEAMADLVQNGLGYALVSKEMAKRFLERCDVCLLNQGRSIEQPIALAWYSRPQASDYWKVMVRSIK
jgi:DNA-binding transcriptional LysR family regulator